MQKNSYIAPHRQDNCSTIRDVGLSQGVPERLDARSLWDQHRQSLKSLGQDNFPILTSLREDLEDCLRVVFSEASGEDGGLTMKVDEAQIYQRTLVYLVTLCMHKDNPSVAYRTPTVHKSATVHKSGASASSILLSGHVVSQEAPDIFL